MALSPDLDRASLEVLRAQHETAVHDMQLFEAIVRALESMTPEGRALALRRLSYAFPLNREGKEPPALPRLTLEQSKAVDTDFRTLTYGTAVETLFRLMGNRRPMSTKVLIGRLASVRKKVKGRDPYRILYRTLMKDPRFVNISGQWALAEWYGQDSADGSAETNQLTTEMEEQVEEEKNRKIEWDE